MFRLSPLVACLPTGVRFSLFGRCVCLWCCVASNAEQPVHHAGQAKPSSSAGPKTSVSLQTSFQLSPGLWFQQRRLSFLGTFVFFALANLFSSCSLCRERELFRTVSGIKCCFVFLRDPRVRESVVGVTCVCVSFCQVFDVSPCTAFYRIIKCPVFILTPAFRRLSVDFHTGHGPITCHRSNPVFRYS